MSATSITYSGLFERIGAYLEKAKAPDTTAYAEIPHIIALAQRAIVSELKLQGYERTLRSYMEAGKDTVAKPDRWRHTISMSVNINGRMQPIFPRSYEYCRSYWPDPRLTDAPKFYADHEASHWLIVPTPAAAFGWEIKVHLLPKMLSEQQQTNWLTDIGSNALLMRCLKEMALFLKKPDEAQVFEAEYGKAISALAQEDAKKLMDRAAERDGA